MKKKLTTVLLVFALSGAGLGSVFAKGKTLSEKGKVNFEVKMNDSLGSSAEQWEQVFEESAEKEGYDVVDKDDEDSTKVTVFIGKDDDDDDNDGIKDSADKDDDGDGIEDATQSEEDYNLDEEVPQLLETGKNENKTEGVYFAVVGENGKMNVFRSAIDDFSFNDKASSEIFGNGSVFQNVSYSPKMSAKRAFPIGLALKITFQVAKTGYQIYKITKK